MKPSWQDAPDWAMMLAMDDSGLWWWFEKTDIVLLEGGWYSTTGGKIAEAGGECLKPYKEHRPAYL